MADQKQYLRFTLSQILEHWVLFVSFTGLAITGLPQKFVGNSMAESFIGLLGGIEQVRTIHHICAIIMVLAAIYHVIVLTYKVFVLRVRWTMFPRLDDALDALDAVRYNLGLTREHPKFDRFNFAEKAEYWALVWGTIIMGLTGFIMWNPIMATRFLPGDLIPASKAAHGAEAILAVLAIIVWHFYNVHIKTLNKTVFTGKLTEAQMHEEHALELERIQKGKIDPRPSPEVIKSRDRVFIPVAAVSAIVMLIAVFFLTSFENTAVTPDWTARRSRAQVFAPITPTRIPVGTPAPSNVSSAKPLPVSHEGRTTCLACHQSLSQPKLPADHAGRTDATCAACHKVGGGPSAPASTGSQGTTSVPASSSLGGAKPQPAGHERWSGTCLGCHSQIQQPALPADHKDRGDSTCAMCHKGPGTASSGTSNATPAPTSSSATPAGNATNASSGPSAQPADHAGRTTCLACHQNLPQPKLPADHAGRTDATCAACHKPK